MELLDISGTEEIYSVSRLNREARFLLEGNFPLLWVEGEISNFAAPHSGHWYFSLKDNQAQVRCAMFKPHNRKLGFIPKDGMQVILKARVSLYEGRGDFQLLTEHLEEAGLGKLQQAFEALKRKLHEAGLFDTAHKKPLPSIPKCIGIVTSPTGAAIQDILSILKRRFPSTPVILYPTLVQGESAAPAIVNAIQKANQRNECDVLIVTRGGGSLEDLWPFNEEIVAHAIYQSSIPTISAVGHEIDFTIADFVADLRAPTPSAAAELVTPDKNELLETLLHQQKHFFRIIQQECQQQQHVLTLLKQQIKHYHPQHKLQEQSQTLDYAENKLYLLQQQQLQKAKQKVTQLVAAIKSQTPLHQITEIRHRLQLKKERLINLVTSSLKKEQSQLTELAAKLDALSPLATLSRGFSITLNKKTQRIIRSTKDIKAGEIIEVKLMEGTLECAVEKTIVD